MSGSRSHFNTRIPEGIGRDLICSSRSRRSPEGMEKSRIMPGERMWSRQRRRVQNYERTRSGLISTRARVTPRAALGVDDGLGVFCNACDRFCCQLLSATSVTKSRIRVNDNEICALLRVSLSFGRYLFLVSLLECELLWWGSWWLH